MTNLEGEIVVALVGEPHTVVVLFLDGLVADESLLGERPRHPDGVLQLPDGHDERQRHDLVVLHPHLDGGEEAELRAVKVPQQRHVQFPHSDLKSQETLKMIYFMLFCPNFVHVLTYRQLFSLRTCV